MTPTRLRECLEALGWSQRFLAERLSINPRVPQKWAAGQSEIPPEVAAWLEGAARALEEQPLPEGWAPR